ncbi:MAG: hypothetical protein K5745_02405 [Saccharofermentans sp.]|nr:hypothetical protein [Saccharofermentans sp.]
MSNNIQIPESHRPISMWGYFGYELLFSIPLIGLICLIVFAFGGTGNVNVKNFARSYFCCLILVVIISVIVIAIAAATGSMMYLSDVLG